MPLFLLEAGAAEGDALVEQDVVADFHGLAHHDAHAVIDKEAAADLSAGMNFDSVDEARDLAHEAAEKLEVTLPEPMCDAVVPDGVQTGIQEHDFDRGARGGVAVEDRLDVFLHSAQNTHGTYLLLQRRVRLSNARRDCSPRIWTTADAFRFVFRPRLSHAASHYPCAACIRPSQPALASSPRPRCSTIPRCPIGAC